MNWLPDSIRPVVDLNTIALVTDPPIAMVSFTRCGKQAIKYSFLIPPVSIAVLRAQISPPTSADIVFQDRLRRF